MKAGLDDWAGEPVTQLLEHEEFVLSLARNLMRDDSAADDLAQETWLRIMDAKPRALRSPNAWLRTVLKQLAITSYRSEEARSAREQRYSGTSPGSSPQDRLEEAELRASMARGLDGLGEDQREAIVLRFYEDLPPREIAERLDLPVETVRTRIKRGLAVLRNRLDDDADGDRKRWMAAMVGLARVPGAASVGAGVGLLQLGLAVALLGALVFFLVNEFLLPLGGEPEAVAVMSAPEGEAIEPMPRAEAGDRVALLSGSNTSRASVVPPGPSGEFSLTVAESPSGKPAAEAVFLLTPLSLSEVEPIRGVCDGAGRARVSLPAGLWRVEASRGRPTRAHVRAGKLTEFLLEVPALVTVTGTVRDEDEAPIAWAEVYLTWPFRNDQILDRADTDGSGRFKIEGVDPNCWIGASASGHRDSDVHFLGDPLPAFEPEREVDIFLWRSSPLATGRVHDRDGQPISGALVQPVLDLSSTLWRRPLEAFVSPATHQDSRAADAEGRFSLQDLPPFTWALVVTAPGYAPALKSIQLETLSSYGSRIEIVLDEGCTVQGSVQLPDGAPAVDSEVIVRVTKHLGPFRTRTDKDGRYRLEHLPRANLILSAHRLDGTTALAAEGVIDGTSGSVEPWDPRLVVGEGVGGQCLWPSGEPAAGVWVALQVARDPLEDWVPNLNPMEPRWLEADEHGRFQFSGCFSRAYRADLWMFEPEGPRHLDHFEKLSPGPESQAFQIGPSRCAIEGKILNEASEPRNQASLWLNSSAWDQPRAVPVDAGTGRFRLEDLSVGKYALFMWRVGKSPRKVSAISLDRGEEIQLEPIVLSSPGDLHISARDASQVGDGLLEIALYEGAVPGKSQHHPLAALSAIFSEEDPITIEGILPGDYVLTVGGGRRVVEYFPLSIRPSETTELELEFAPCARGPIEFVMPADGGEQYQLRFLLLDSETRVRLKVVQPSTEPGGTPGLRRLPVELPVGRYTYRARLIGAPFTASGVLVVTDAVDQESLGVIELVRKED